MSLRLFVTLAWLAASSGLSAAAQSPAGGAPSDWDTDVNVREVSDLNADPSVVEVNLTARLASVEVAPAKRVSA